MNFEWEEPKRLANLAKHDIDFLDAIEVFAVPHLEQPARLTAGEPRCIVTGIVGDRTITVIFVRRGGATRLISARSARHGERRRYQALFD